MTLVKYLRQYDIPIRTWGEDRRRYQLCDSTPFAEPQTDWQAEATCEFVSRSPGIIK